MRKYFCDNCGEEIKGQGATRYGMVVLDTPIKTLTINISGRAGECCLGCIGEAIRLMDWPKAKHKVNVNEEDFDENRNYC
jgi:hypothetical protein